MEVNKILITDIVDGDRNEFRNFVLETRLTDPEKEPVQGQFYYNTNTDLLRYYTGKGWKSIGTIEGLTSIISSDDSITTVITEGVADLVLNFTDEDEIYDDSIDNKAISPKSLSARVATEDKTGIIRIATDNEAEEGESDYVAMTPKKTKKVAEGVSTKIVQDIVINGGLSDKNFIHHQNFPSATWEINHDLGKKPSVTITDSADTVVEGQIIINDGVKVLITFNAPFTGIAILN